MTFLFWLTVGVWLLYANGERRRLKRAHEQQVSAAIRMETIWRD